jgi:uncharacterized membrane protein
MKYARKWHTSIYRAIPKQGDAVSDSVNIRTFHVIVDAPAEILYDVVTDLSNMPRWAFHFCKDIRLIDDGAIVTSPSGEVYFGVTGDRDLGIIDWWSGPTMQTAERWPTRVVGLADGRSLYQVTAIFGGAAPPNVDQLFNEELEALKRLVENQLVEV